MNSSVITSKHLQVWNTAKGRSHETLMARIFIVTLMFRICKFIAYTIFFKCLIHGHHVGKNRSRLNPSLSSFWENHSVKVTQVAG